MNDTRDTICLEGRLDAAQVAAIERRYRERFAHAGPPAIVSLAGIEAGDSSALALLLDWQARAHEHGRHIRFDQPPESLRVIARLTGIAPLLGWAENGSGAEPAKGQS